MYSLRGEHCTTVSLTYNKNPSNLAFVRKDAITMSRVCSSSFIQASGAKVLKVKIQYLSLSLSTVFHCYRSALYPLPAGLPGSGPPDRSGLQLACLPSSSGCPGDVRSSSSAKPARSLQHTAFHTSRMRSNTLCFWICM